MYKWILLFAILFLMGCHTTLADYQNCMNDPVCAASVENSRVASYQAVKASSSSLFPSFNEALALVLSNIVAFVVGVIKGRKKRG